MIFSAILLARWLTDLDFYLFRIFGNYFSLFIFYLCFIALRFDKNSSDFERLIGKVFVFSAAVYLAGSLLQLSGRVFDLKFLIDFPGYLLGNGGRTSEVRGFNSFTAEPSYAGIVSSLFIVFGIVLRKDGLLSIRQFKYSIICYVLVVLLSSSATALPFFLVALLALVRHLGFSLKAIALFSSVSTSILVFGFFWIFGFDPSGNRLLSLAILFLDGGIVEIYADVSAASRFASIINYSLPLIFGGYLWGSVLVANDATLILPIIDGLNASAPFKEMLRIGFYAEGGGLRTKSAISQSLFLFGVFAVLFWIVWLVRFFLPFYNLPGNKYIALLVFGGYLVQVPLGHPLFCFVTGYAFYRSLRLKDKRLFDMRSQNVRR